MIIALGHWLKSSQILNWLSIIEVDQTKIQTKFFFLTRNFVFWFTIIMTTKRPRAGGT